MLAARSDYFSALLARVGGLEPPCAAARRQQPRSSSSSSTGEPGSTQEQQLGPMQSRPAQEQGSAAAGAEPSGSSNGSAQQQAHASGGERDPGRPQRQHEAGTSGQPGQPPWAGGAELPSVAVSGVSAAIFGVVLRHVYMDGVPDLAPEFQTDEGAEALFDAADRYLLFTMKVQRCLACLIWLCSCVRRLVPACSGSAPLRV